MDAPFNEFAVGRAGDHVVVMRPPRLLTKEQAIALAVYLRVLSGASDEEWDAVHNAVLES